MSTKCGWCISGDHANHKASVSWYDRTWNCDCETCVGPVVEEPKKRKTRSDKGKPRGPRKNPT